MIRKILVYAGCLVLGALFMLSAWFKLFPIEPFEYNITGTTFFGWTASVFVARVVIGAEFAIGIMLLSAHRLRRTLLLTAGVLLLFSAHLLSVLLTEGNQGDCGCMGSLLSLTPAEGLLKNAVMLLLILPMYRYAGHFAFRIPYLHAWVMAVGVASVFIANPVDLAYSSRYLNRPFDKFALPLDTLYRLSDTSRAQPPVRDLRAGKSVLMFVSASCPHCRIAASKAAVMHKKNPGIPFYFFINGEDDKIRKFLEQTRTSAIPHSRLNGPIFVGMAGLNLPVIYYYHNGMVEQQVDYYTLEQAHVEAWMLHENK